MKKILMFTEGEYLELLFDNDPLFCDRRAL